MKNQWKMILCLSISLAALSGCARNQGTEGEQGVFTEATQYLGPPVEVTEAPVEQNVDEQNQGGQSIFDSNPFTITEGDDQFSEEDVYGEEEYDQEDDFYQEDNGVDSAENSYLYEDPNATLYPYAGSTPIPLDPIDMPPPTPKPALIFTYVPYSVATLGLSFSGPDGWIPDESGYDVFTLTEPPNYEKDGQLGTIKIYASQLASDYSESNLKREVTQRLDEIGNEFEKWEPTLTASRYLMGSKGIYANYSGTLPGGIQVGGRIHSTSVDNVLYTIEIMYPLGYREDFLKVFVEMRSSLKRQ